MPYPVQNVQYSTYQSPLNSGNESMSSKAKKKQAAKSDAGGMTKQVATIPVIRALPQNVQMYIHFTGTRQSTKSIDNIGLRRPVNRDVPVGGFGTPGRSVADDRGIFAYEYGAVMRDSSAYPIFIVTGPAGLPQTDPNNTQGGVMFARDLIMPISYARNGSPHCFSKELISNNQTSNPPSEPSRIDSGPGAAGFLNAVKGSREPEFTGDEARLALIMRARQLWPIHAGAAGNRDSGSSSGGGGGGSSVGDPTSPSRGHGRNLSNSSGGSGDMFSMDM